MDPMYSGDLFIDGYHTIKTESMGGSGGGGGGGMESNSVPIPVARRPANLEYLFETSPCGSSLQEHLLTGGSSLYSGPSVWSPRSEMKMDDDDILQVDESDLIQGPTLAELNANDETLLEDLNFDDLLLPEEKSYLIEVDSVRVAEPQPTQPVVYGSVGPLHELLLQTSPVPMAGASSPVAVGSRLSSSAPTHLGIWQRREPRPHLLSTSSLAEATSTSSLSTGGVMSPEAYDFSLDEGFDSEDDSDHYEDFSSDAESVSDGEGGRSKKERFFWQYNVQAKGPKGQRLVLKQRQEDPHFLDEVTDPVFSPQCSVQGIKHSGKARKGDGNDLTPNPRKLHAIGRELEKLGRIINDMTPVSELPFSARPKTRKEKNKLASRACRLKKKAQHEANKIKLCGLESEHKRLMTGIQEMKQLLMTKVSNDEQEVGKMADKVVKNATKLKIAGQSTEFVNRVLDKVKSGVAMGGLDELYH